MQSVTSQLSKASNLLKAPVLPPPPKLPVTKGPDDSDPGFTVPPRKGRDRLTQPVGTDSHQLQVRAGLTRLPLRQPLAATAEETGFAGSQNPKVAEAGFGVLGVQRAVAAAFAGFNIFSASDKLKRYNQQLQSMLDDDVAKFKASVALGNTAEEGRGPAKGLVNDQIVQAEYEKKLKEWEEETAAYPEAMEEWTKKREAYDEAIKDPNRKQQASAPADPKGKGRQIDTLEDPGDPPVDPGKAPEKRDIEQSMLGYSKLYPRLETLILKKVDDGAFTKDKNGINFTKDADGKITVVDNRKFEYDMEKVAALAASKDPALAAERTHARNILLTDHIANQLARKQRNRAIYDLTRNTLGAVGSIVAAVSSHGTAAAATEITKHTALRTAGYGVSALASGNPAKGVRNRKQLLREEKKQRIDSNALLRRDDFIEETKDGFQRPAVDAVFFKTKEAAEEGIPELEKAEVEAKQAQITAENQAVEQGKTREEIVAAGEAAKAKVIQAAKQQQIAKGNGASYAAETHAVDDMPQEAIAAARDAIRDQARREINKRNQVSLFTKTRNIDESRVYVNKKDERDDVAEHAYEIVKHLIGADNPDNLAGFREVLRAADNSGRQRDTLLADKIEKSPNLQTAYQLLRDMGGGKSESVQIIRRSMEHAVDSHLSKDPAMAKVAGLENYDPARAAKDVTKSVASWLKRR